MKYISISSGSSGNCHFVQSGSARILVDAGLSGKKIEEGLNYHHEQLKKVNGIFITHEHSDHVKGVGIISRKYDLPIYATAGTWNAMEKNIGNIAAHNINEIKIGKRIELDDIAINSFPTSHDGMESCGFFIDNGKKTLAIVTDLGYVSDEVYENVEGVDLAVIESNYDPEMLKYSSYPYHLKQRIKSDVGHLSNMEAGFFGCALIKSGTKRLLLAHLSKENNMPLLAYQAVDEVLKGHGITSKDVGLDVLKRDTVSDIFTV